MKNGIYKMEDAEYFAITDRANATTLKTMFTGSPYELLFNKNIDKGGIGKATHKYCEMLNLDGVISLPNEKGYSSLTTLKAIDFAARNLDKIVLSSGDYGKLKNIIDATENRTDKDTTFVRSILNNKSALKENVILFDLVVGDIKIPCKAKIDLFLPDVKMLVDHKSTKEGKGKFEYDYDKLAYWLQLHFYALAVAAHYNIEVHEVDMKIFSFQTTAPHVIQPHDIQFSPDVIGFIHLLAMEWRELQLKKSQKYNYFKNKKSVLKMTHWTLEDIKRKTKDLLGV